jgi:hypothetical protein
LDNVIDFDIKSYEPLQDFEPLPKNQYVLRITDAKLNLTNKGKVQGTGERAIRLDLMVTEGEHKGRVIFDFLNVENASEKAQDYARRKLRTICTILDKVDIFSIKKDLNILIGGVIGADILVDNTMQKPTNKINFYLRAEKVVDIRVAGVQSDQISDSGKNNELNDDIPF